MSDDNEQDDDFSIEELEELDEELLEQFAEAIERQANIVFSNNLTKDGRKELVNVLMSLAASLSVDIEVSPEEFLDMASLFYDEAENYDDFEDENYDKYRLN